MKVLLICQEPLAERMAGPAIRYWELAHALAAFHDVTLAAPAVERTSSTVMLAESPTSGRADLLAGADVCISQQLIRPLVAHAWRARTRLVMDAYDPLVLENLFAEGAHPVARRAHIAATGALTDFGLLSADAVICASDRQRDLWLGSLLTLGRVGLHDVATDPSLQGLVSVVPFGLPAGTPDRSLREGKRQELGCSPETTLALWGGGIWEWLDPVTVIRGVAAAREASGRDIRLVFMGTKRPVAIAETGDAALAAAVAAARDCDLLGTGVIFAEGWVPYAERQAFLAAADIGVSAHHDHAETRFSFRTRVLDYLWAGLPTVLTAGDSMSDLAARDGSGFTPGDGDVAGWAKAFEALATDPTAAQAMSAAASRRAEDFRWSSIAAGLSETLERVVAERPTPKPVLGRVNQLVRFYASATVSSAYQGRIRELLPRRPSA